MSNTYFCPHCDSDVDKKTYQAHRRSPDLLPAKVAYGLFSTAYLDTALPDGTYTGTNKHTDLPVHLRWDEKACQWFEVCHREFRFDIHSTTEWTEILPRQSCTCWEAEDARV